MPFWGRRNQEDTTNQPPAEADPSSAGAGPHDSGGVYDQDADEANTIAGRGGAQSYHPETGYRRPESHPYDRNAPYDQDAPYPRDLCGNRVPEIQRFLDVGGSSIAQDEPPIAQEGPPVAQEGLGVQSEAFRVPPSPHPVAGAGQEHATDGGGHQAPLDSEPADSAPAFPEPVVIGASPSFPAKLGTLSTKAANMSGSAVPDTALDGGDLPDLLVRGASLRGEDHRNTGIIRQDSMGMWRVTDGKRAAVLACATDGVGSEPFSHRGAVAACQLLRDLTQVQLSRFFKAAESAASIKLVWELLASQLAQQLSEMAVRQNMDPKTVSTTLAAALIEESPTHPAEHRYVILNVGDATAYLLHDGQFINCLADSHGGDITDTKTWSLPTSVGDVGATVGILRPGDMLMVCSDGMSNPMTNDNVREQLARWWGGEQVPGLMEFGWQVGYRVKSYGDDRTAVCIWSR